METRRHRRIEACLCMIAVFLWSCTRQPQRPPDRPRLTPGVALRDVTFHSAALNRDMQYRVFLPTEIPPGRSLPVVYLLHGGGGGFRDWSNYSDVSGFAGTGTILCATSPCAAHPLTAGRTIGFSCRRRFLQAARSR